MIGTTSCQCGDVTVIIFESLLIILQQHHVLLKAIASLLRICCQKSYLPLQEWCCNYITEPPPGQAPGPRLHHSAAPCPYEGERPAACSLTEYYCKDNS